MSKILIPLIFIGLAFAAVYIAKNSQLQLNQQIVQSEQADPPAPINPPHQPVKKANQDPLDNQEPQKVQMYKWTDENGKIHFSDKPPEGSQANNEKITVEAVSTTKFKKTNRVVPTYQSRQKSQTSAANTVCDQLTQQINKLQKELKERMRARTYARKEKQLDELRRRKIMEC
ncbi:MAG: DUF4124 domain-containing protein [Kangiellaceae bacterium]|nr:DUF4124 domain-containing protein [Kangiellaceae bacterium]MCW8997781.1 DUF4124 domain-containing protein [Kangiellaceae bacterium]